MSIQVRLTATLIALLIYGGFPAAGGQPAGSTSVALAQGCAPAWQAVFRASDLESKPNLMDIGAVAPNSVVGVGYYHSADNWMQPAIVRWDGTRAGMMPSPAVNPENRRLENRLNGVAVVSPSEIWAVGSRGAMVSSPSGQFAGEQPLVERWDGTAWRIVDVPARAPLRSTRLEAVAAAGPGDAWAVGRVQDGAQIDPLALHWDGRSWSELAVPKPNAQRAELLDVAAVAPNESWAVGSYGGSGESGALLARWKDGSWQTRTIPAPAPPAAGMGSEFLLRSVAASGPSDVWAVGSLAFFRPSGRPSTPPIMAGLETVTYHWNGSDWRRVPSPNPGSGAALLDVTTTAPGRAWAVGYYVSDQGQRGLILSWDGGKWAQVESPVQDPLLYVDGGPTRGLWAAGSSTVLRYADPCAEPAPPGGQNPAERVPDPRDPGVTYFPEVGHTLRGVFRDYWHKHGGLRQFGYPRTEEFQEKNQTDGKVYTVQYFERNRFEYHPENNPPHNVLLGLLGRTITAGRRDEAPFRRVADPGSGARFYPETGHVLAPQLAAFWDRGGLAVYGYPISEAFVEKSPTDGKEYLVQYFERNRLELHPELPEPYRISLGLLGTQLLKERGWIR